MVLLVDAARHGCGRGSHVLMVRMLRLATVVVRVVIMSLRVMWMRVIMMLMGVIVAMRVGVVAEHCRRRCRALVRVRRVVLVVAGGRCERGHLRRLVVVGVAVTRGRAGNLL